MATSGEAKGEASTAVATGAGAGSASARPTSAADKFLPTVEGGREALKAMWSSPDTWIEWKAKDDGEPVGEAADGRLSKDHKLVKFLESQLFGADKPRRVALHVACKFLDRQDWPEGTSLSHEDLLENIDLYFERADDFKARIMDALFRRILDARKDPDTGKWTGTPRPESPAAKYLPSREYVHGNRTKRKKTDGDRRVWPTRTGHEAQPNKINGLHWDPANIAVLSFTYHKDAGVTGGRPMSADLGQYIRNHGSFVHEPGTPTTGPGAAAADQRADVSRARVEPLCTAPYPPRLHPRAMDVLMSEDYCSYVPLPFNCITLVFVNNNVDFDDYTRCGVLHTGAMVGRHWVAPSVSVQH